MSLATSFGSATFTQLRGLPWLALSETGYILTLGTGDNQGGGGGGTWTQGTAVVPCRVDAIGAQSGELANQLNERSTCVILMPPNAAVTTQNRVAITGRGTYEVTAVRTRTSEFVHELEAVEK